MKKPLPKFTQALLLLLPLLGHGQETHISGRVVDAKTKESIPFAAIGLLKEGTAALTNEKGYFQVIGPNKFEQDSLVLMKLGYYSRIIYIKNSKKENFIIELNPQPVILADNCLRRAYVVDSESLRVSKNVVIYGLPGTKFAFFIENDKGKQPRKLQSASVYVGENGLPMQAFRICIYKADGTNHSPSTKLLDEPAFLTVPRAGEWYTRDLSRYNVIAPKEGYYVALEFGKPADALPQLNMDNYIPTGQMMRPVFEFKKSNIWTHSQEKGWILPPQSNSSRRYNAMIKVEVKAVE